METEDIKEYYNQNLKEAALAYEQRRWHSSPQARAGYGATKAAIRRAVTPLVTPTAEIWELGPGPGTWTRELLAMAPKAKYTLVDISEEMLKQAQATLPSTAEIQLVVADIMDYQPTTPVDLFFSSRMIEYVPNKEVAMKTIMSGIKQGGYGVLITKTPQYQRPFSRRLTQAFHANQVEPAVLSRLIVDAGGEVTAIRAVTSVFPKLRSGWADTVLSSIFQRLPFWCGRLVSESYLVVFTRK